MTIKIKCGVLNRMLKEKKDIRLKTKKNMNKVWTSMNNISIFAN